MESSQEPSDHLFLTTSCQLRRPRMTLEQRTPREQAHDKAEVQDVEEVTTKDVEQDEGDATRNGTQTHRVSKETAPR